MALGLWWLNWCIPVIMVFYMFYERLFRAKGKETTNMKGGADDAGTTLTNMVMIITLDLLVFLGFFVPRPWFARMPETVPEFETLLAISMMLFGCLLRASAMLTLGKFFSRSLVVQEKQKVVDSGVYSVVRHPGYAANMLVWLPACFVLLRLWIFVIVVGTVAIVWHRRIYVEEEMMLKHLGPEYKTYSEKVPYRMFPLLY